MNRSISLAAVLPVTVVVAAGALVLSRKERTAKQLERFGAAALETLLNAIDANDPVTGAHVRRVARYAIVLGDAMGVDDHQGHDIERVALFHDIGKIHEALFDVIHEDNKLSESERRAVNTHPQRGADVLKPLAAFYPDLPEGVLSHHERWDGTGYPRGLKGTAIPLSARVVAIADTFDAITHARRYRPGRTFTVGEELIAEGRGTQFDPDIVDLFLSPPVIKRIRDEKQAAAAAAVEKGSGHRPKRAEEDVEGPDVSFRWRGSAPAQPAQPPHSAARPA
ncbi:MAG: HD-GYP domain-containing protein [Gemmatimonadaceae bacterium]